METGKDLSSNIDHNELNISCLIQIETVMKCIVNIINGEVCFGLSLQTSGSVGKIRINLILMT